MRRAPEPGLHPCCCKFAVKKRLNTVIVFGDRIKACTMHACRRHRRRPRLLPAACGMPRIGAALHTHRLVPPGSGSEQCAAYAHDGRARRHTAESELAVFPRLVGGCARARNRPVEGPPSEAVGLLRTGATQHAHLVPWQHHWGCGRPAVGGETARRRAGDTWRRCCQGEELWFVCCSGHHHGTTPIAAQVQPSPHASTRRL